MADKLLVEPRKGLFVIERSATGWEVSRAALLDAPQTRRGRGS